MSCAKVDPVMRPWNNLSAFVPWRQRNNVGKKNSGYPRALPELTGVFCEQKKTPDTRGHCPN